MLKQELRLHYLARRNEMSPVSLEAGSIAIANNLLELPLWSFDYFHIYLTISEKKEVNTCHILSILQGRGKYAVIPKTGPGNTLLNYLLTDETLIKKGRWNLPEPTGGMEVPADKIDVIFVPLLAFDVFGHRVGYGKGYYDRFMASCRPDMIKIGLSMFEAEAAIPDTHDGDIRLDYCVTPVKVYEFT